MATSGTGAIATRSNLYYCGHTYLLDSGYSSYEAVTYGDISTAISKNFMSSATYSGSYDSTKCVQYASFKTTIVRQPWLVKISENVGGKTRADVIELRYYYKTTSTAAETYKVAGTWSYGSNISGSAQATHYFEANPYALYNGTVYSGYLAIWCGECGGKQSWKYKLRIKSRTNGLNGTWASSWTGLSGTAKSKLVPILQTTGSNTYCQAMDLYNGIEFNID